MHKFIKNSIARPLILPKPTNQISKFIYNDLPDKSTQKLIQSKLNTTINIPTIIDGKEYTSNSKIQHVSPLNKNAILYEAHIADKKLILDKLNNPTFDLARRHWNSISIESRINYLEIVANRIDNNVNNVRNELLTDTIVGQGKSIYEAEIDAICETVDFLRFNNYYASVINNIKLISNEYEYNFSEINGLNGFVAAITPFNFTAISANLISAPLLMGNPVIWKPSDSAILSNYTYFKLLLECNIPPELISFTPMKPHDFMDTVVGHPDMAGIAFTGSSHVFDNINKFIGNGINRYRNYPRIVGETGGKNFHFVHESADSQLVGEKTFQSAFDYSGQKCSACSVLYCPNNLFDDVIHKIKDLIEENNAIQYHNNGLINQDSFNKTKQLLQDINNDSDIDIIVGGTYDNTKYNYVEPTIVISNNLDHYVFKKEFFAPFLAIYKYDPKDYDYVMHKCVENNEYNLTGSIFGKNKSFILNAYEKLRFNAGNFYINDKSTGSVVGRQPFGGFGKSGNCYKPGDASFLYQFTNQRSIKFNPHWFN